jgi:V8-like Glu-specific endopeptidase
VSQKGTWRYEIHGIEGRVDPSLGKRLKPDGDGWIVPPAAASWDFGLIVLRYPPSGITPLPLFDGDKDALTAALKAADRKVTQSGYPVDHLDTLYPHRLYCDGLGANQRTLASVRYVAGRQWFTADAENRQRLAVDWRAELCTGGERSLAGR